MVMPYGVKKTELGEGAPVKVDFDRLWTKAVEPALRTLGYDPVRADRDVGASIIREMIERLTLSDLVVADLSIPNPNVFYEVGVRHAARANGCVLIGARWSRQPFDVDQMRTVKYELADGLVTDEEAETVRATLEREIPRYVASPTPCFELEGFPDFPLERAQSFRDFVRRLQSFQAQTTAIRLMRDAKKRVARIQELVDGAGALSPALVPELLALVRDYGVNNWRAVVDFIDGLPAEQQKQVFVEEQRWLAMSKLGEHEASIGALNQLIARYGETPERLGLLGGRYKRLWIEARLGDEERLAAGHLDSAIDHYRRGMWLDLNEYYCSSNLPRLLRQRNDPGDEAEARRVADCVLMACARARRAGSDDPWLPLTLLGAAFDAGDADEVENLLRPLERGARPAWTMMITLQDVDMALSLLPDDAPKDRLWAQRDRLAQIASESR